MKFIFSKLKFSQDILLIAEDTPLSLLQVLVLPLTILRLSSFKRRCKYGPRLLMRTCPPKRKAGQPLMNKHVGNCGRDNTSQRLSRAYDRKYEQKTMEQKSNDVVGSLHGRIVKKASIEQRRFRIYSALSVWAVKIQS